MGPQSPREGTPELAGAAGWYCVSAVPDHPLLLL